MCTGHLKALRRTTTAAHSRPQHEREQPLQRAAREARRPGQRSGAGLSEEAGRERGVHDAGVDCQCEVVTSVLLRIPVYAFGVIVRCVSVCGSRQRRVQQKCAEAMGRRGKAQASSAMASSSMRRHAAAGSSSWRHQGGGNSWQPPTCRCAAAAQMRSSCCRALTAHTR